VADPAVQPEHMGEASPDVWVCDDCMEEFEQEHNQIVCDVLSLEEYQQLREWVKDQAQQPNTSLDLSTQIELLREQLGGLLEQLEGIHDKTSSAEGYWVAGNVNLEGARTAMNRTGGAL